MSVYVNRTINMKKIKAVGFDMDYTIVGYNTYEFEKVTHHEVLKKLVSLKGYPQKITELEFDDERSIQGLVIDKKRGNLLKVSRFSKVKDAYYGLERLGFREQQNIYRNRRIDLKHDNFQSLDTSFAISNGVLFGQLVELKKNGLNLPDYTVLADEIKEVLDICHADGTIKDQVRDDLPRFIKKDPEVAKLLELYKEHGKKLMIVTNSDFNYSQLLMDYAVDPYLKNHKSWKELFDITITLANKPNFFTMKNNFLAIDPETSLMTNHFGKIETGIFQGGWAGKLQDDLGLEGDEILYLGDHIYGDVVSIKKTFNWRTAMVLDPLKEEIDSIKKSDPIQEKINLLMDEKQGLERKLSKQEEKKYQDPKSINRDDLSKLYSQIDKLNHEISENIARYNEHYNPYWGELMRAGQEESRMADQVEKYACLYMTKVSDLLEYGPRTYFRPEKRMLPHEVSTP